MKKQLVCAMAAAGIVMLSACSKEEAAPVAEVKVDAVATVNGKPISKALFEATQKEMSARGANAESGEKLVDDLVGLELLRQEADKLNLAKEAQVAVQLESMTRNLLAQAAVENFRKTAKITDEELKKEYDDRVAESTAMEFKAAHILLDTEEAAKKALAKLQKGDKFAALAKKLSKDPGSAQNGGDLGWFNPQQMVPEFAAALTKLEKGAMTTEPVKSQFGWHIILLEDSRKPEPPPFDSVKEQVRGMLVMKKLEKHVEGLKTAAKIERTPLPKPAAPAAAPAAEAAKPDAAKAEAKPEAAKAADAPAKAEAPAEKPAAEKAAK